jgi:hypothetical protein
VGIGEKDKAKLRQRVLDALGAESLSESEFKLATFEKGILHGTLVDNIDPLRSDKVLFYLNKINMYMRLKSKEAPMSHVMLVYYKGSEELTKEGHFLMLRDKDMLNSKSLEDELANVQGAPILLLDVLRRAGAEKLTIQEAGRLDRIANLSPDAAIAVMRLAKLGGAPLVPDASLMKAWNAALSQSHQATRLSEVEKRISDSLEPLMRKDQSLHYDRVIPTSLADLLVGQLDKAR